MNRYIPALENSANAMLTIVPASGAPTTQVFDANGNLTLSTTGSAVTTNTWSAANQLLSQVSPSVNEQYLYSQDGMRQQKINGTGTTKFTLDGPNVLLETTTAGALQARNTQEPIGYGGLISQNRSSASSFYGFDSQQSARILVSVGGIITDSLSFKAFGEELQTGSGTVNPFWFGGQVGYFRDLPGVMNLGWRKLIAANGVFLNRDLIGFSGGDVNLMRFVGNNPVVRVDPSGYSADNAGVMASAVMSPQIGPDGGRGRFPSGPGLGTGGLIATVLRKAWGGDCGEAHFEIRWKIPPYQKGAVIQHVTMHAVITDCDGNPVPPQNGACPDGTDYWEGWPVTLNGDELDDWYNIPEQGPNPNTKGSYFIVGKARFVPKYTLNAPPWFPNGTAGHNDCAGILATMNEPGPTDLPNPTPPPATVSWSDNGTVNHILIASWDCCCGRSKATTVWSVPGSGNCPPLLCGP